LFTGPALRALRTVWPDAHVTLMVGPWGREVAERLPGVDELLFCAFPWFDRRPKGAPWSPYARLIREARRLREREFDAAVVLRFDFWWGAALTALAGVPQRIGYALPEMRPFLTTPVAYAPGRHEVEQNWRLLREGLGLADVPALGSLVFPVTDAEREWAERALPGGPWCVLVVGAGAPVKLWRTEAFAAVGAALAERHGLRLAVAGTQEEAGRVEAVLRGLPVPAVPLIGLPLGELAAALERSALTVGADSGAMHLAVAVGSPTVHLYGPVSVSAFGPWGPASRHRTVVSPLACVPCNRLDWPLAELEAHPCIREMPVAWVLAAAEQVLAASAVQRAQG
jgi:ADP-heptose:LPS heptosyltransferase